LKSVKRYDECKLKFKCSVTANGAKYDSPSGFKRKKLAQNAAVEAAVRDLLKQSLLMLFEETRLSKIVLDEFALKKNMPPPPTY